MSTYKDPVNFAPTNTWVLRYGINGKAIRSKEFDADDVMGDVVLCAIKALSIDRNIDPSRDVVTGVPSSVE